MKASTVTGWCQRDECNCCDGVVRTGTGYNWWCTHHCHAEPTILPDRPDFVKALEFWKAHR